MRFVIALFIVFLLLATIVITSGSESVRLLVLPSARSAASLATIPAIQVPNTPTATALPTALPTAFPTAFPTVLPTVLPTATRQHPYIPILMYHYVRVVDKAADPFGYDLSVTPAHFAAQIKWLRRAGYDMIQMSALADCIRSDSPCPAHAVAITFDDGYMDAYTNALPVLQKYSATATFYIIRGFVGRKAYMGWDEIRSLRSAGMEIGAHSISHVDLTRLSYDKAVEQIAHSGAEIAAQIGVPVWSFCYPSGRFNATIAKITRDAGYTSATTTIQDGPQDDLFTLPRVRVHGNMTQAKFQATVEAYPPRPPANRVNGF